MKNTAFCPSTLHALQQITSIFDFIWPAYTALWNLRWQVKGYIDVKESANEKVTPEDLRKVFVTKKVHGENLLRLCSNDWQIQENLFAQILLAYAFSIYEGWIDDVGKILGWNKREKDALQFYERDKSNIQQFVIQEFVKTWKDNISDNDILIGNVVYDVAKKNKKYALNSLKYLMVCYRCFKEARNSFIHCNGKVTEQLKKDYEKYKAIVAQIETIMDEAPVFLPLPLVNEKFNLSLRGVVGLYNIIIFLIVTLDTELSFSKYTEKILLYRIKTEPIKKKDKTVKSRILLFFNENKIPYDRGKIDSIVEPISKKGFSLSCNA
ncbi:MAG: hypothetical protein IJJ33_00565 [Victivallales bacterium]|nr:hypothetical protein [Victivallales bacterium]